MKGILEFIVSEKILILLLVLLIVRIFTKNLFLIIAITVIWFLLNLQERYNKKRTETFDMKGREFVPLGAARYDLMGRRLNTMAHDEYIDPALRRVGCYYYAR